MQYDANRQKRPSFGPEWDSQMEEDIQATAAVGEDSPTGSEFFGSDVGSNTSLSFGDGEATPQLGAREPQVEPEAEGAQEEIPAMRQRAAAAGATAAELGAADVALASAALRSHAFFVGLSERYIESMCYWHA